MKFKLFRSYLFWAAVVLIGLAVAIGYPTSRNLEANTNALSVVPARFINTQDLVLSSAVDADSLRNCIGQWIEVEAILTEFYTLTRSTRYQASNQRIAILECTAAWDTDTAVVVARQLLTDTLRTPMEQWSSCDSAARIFQQLYGFKSFEKHLFIDLMVDQYAEGLGPHAFVHGGNCMEYLGEYKSYKKRLENFCYNQIRFKAILTKFEIQGNEIRLSFEHAAIMAVEPTQFKTHVSI
jgi:hypothetical protein